MTIMYTNYEKGFTLIEMLIAVLIFSLSLVALMTISSRSIQSNRAAQDEIIAQYLAAEGIEGVRHIRDTNYIESNSDWLEGMRECIEAGNECIMNVSTTADYFYTLSPCQDICSPALISNDGIYGVISGNTTGFTRSIFLDNSSNDDALAIVSRVEWQQGRAARSIEMESLLMNWQIQN